MCRLYYYFVFIKKKVVYFLVYYLNVILIYVVNLYIWVKSIECFCFIKLGSMNKNKKKGYRVVIVIFIINIVIREWFNLSYRFVWN